VGSGRLRGWGGLRVGKKDRRWSGGVGGRRGGVRGKVVRRGVRGWVGGGGGSGGGGGWRRVGLDRGPFDECHP